MTAPAFRRGGEEAEAASKASGGRFARVNYFSLEENKSTYVRFLTDSPEWIYTKQHPSVPTKNAPADYKGNWPKQMPAVCRHDPAFAAMYSDCYVCDLPIMNPRDTTKPLRPALRTWCLAVEREPVVVEGVTKGYKTLMEEVDERNDKGETTGNKIKQPRMLVVNMGHKNFFSALQGLYTAYGTVCDRDYMIRRIGKELDTDYQIIPMNPVDGVGPGTEAWAKWEKALEDQNIDLGAIIGERASDDYYARFFDATKDGARPSDTKAANGSSAPSAGSQESQPTSNSVDPDRLAALRARVSSTSGVTEAPKETVATGAANPGDFD